MTASRLEYRADIDGLRAIAVLPIMLFHAGVAGFGGGFIGVDVFFVVSGYLITSIIVADMEAGTFTLAGFYERRVRRIFPALFLVIGASVPAALVILVPEHLEDFGQSVIASAFFVSNFFFYQEVGYFEGPSQLHPLLHTWSLAVEEQFYLVFPALLLVTARRHLSKPAVLAGLAFVSFAFGAWRVSNNPTAAFYLLPSRFWELLLGGLLAASSPRVMRSPMSAAAVVCLGLALIAIAVVAYTEHMHFPGAAALLPCLGTALVIYGGRTANRASSLMGSSPLRLVGLLSYSLYLWHFPLITFARHLIVRPFTGVEVLLLVATTFVLAGLTWRYVEQPFRARPGWIRRKTLLRLAGAAMAVSLGFGLFTDFADGAAWRMTPAARTYLDARDDRDTSCLRKHTHCELGPAEGAPRFVVWGDSHASAMLPAFDAAARELELPGAAALRGGCPPALGYRLDHVTAEACAQAIDKGLATALAPDVEQVFLAARWTMVVEESMYGFESGAPLMLLDADTGERWGNRVLLERGLDRVLSRLRTAGKAVVLIGPVPEIGWHVPHTLAQRVRFGRWLNEAVIEPDVAAFDRRNRRTIELLQQIADRHGARLILPHERLCEPAGRCRVLSHGRPLYFDTDHLTATGAMLLLPMLRSELSRLVVTGR